MEAERLVEMDSESTYYDHRDPPKTLSPPTQVEEEVGKTSLEMRQRPVSGGLRASLLGCLMGEERVPRRVKGMGPGRGTRVDLRGKGDKHYYWSRYTTSSECVRAMECRELWKKNRGRKV